jgi:hypothetical protein
MPDGTLPRPFLPWRMVEASRRMRAREGRCRNIAARQPSRPVSISPQYVMWWGELTWVPRQRRKCGSRSRLGVYPLRSMGRVSIWPSSESLSEKYSSSISRLSSSKLAML